jgi:hypothetical protein
MSQLQTVLDALNSAGSVHGYEEEQRYLKAIEIIKQMMQSEPVGYVFAGHGLDYIGCVISGTPSNDYMPVYASPAAPPAVPAGWVSLEDGMPSPHQMVLVARESHVTTGSYTPAFGWAWEEVDGEDEDSIATHWMPLPAAPKVAV